jgi:hypothetical protein
MGSDVLGISNVEDRTIDMNADRVKLSIVDSSLNRSQV